MDISRIGKPNVALRYMYEAIQSEIKNEAPPETIASTKLNFCAILSSLGKHRQAIKQADDAIVLLKKSLDMTKMLNDDLNTSPMHREANMNDVNKIKSTLAIAYFNKATEFEHLNMKSEA